jgi:hypothetical protein
MDKLDTRRINPISHVATLAVLLLIVFEVLIIFGALELKAQTVAKYVPWAYEPFLRLVGEHPESAPRWAMVEEPEEFEPVEPVVSGVSGLDPSAIPVLMGTNGVAIASNVLLEATVPLEIDSVPIPVMAPTNAPKPTAEDVVPVG